MTITILCKVVDNFGDIGVMYRLAKQLQVVSSGSLEINIIIDDLVSFSKINSQIDAEKSFQSVEGLNIYNWNDAALCHSEFSKNDGEKLAVILELFQCGRPDWMEKILFEEKLERTVNIIMVDYLTAEQYAEDFHKLESLTRSKKVQKVNFMPGFTPKTGGLVIDAAWKSLPEYNENGPALVFTYERDWTPLTSSLQHSDVPEVFVAQGRGKDSFVESWEKCLGKGGTDGKEKTLKQLPYLNQPEWDEMMKQCSVLFIRGEESMSRACLSGIPFVWHAYPQTDEYQLVKMNALLERMRPHFPPESFELVNTVWQDFNTPESEIPPEKMRTDIQLFLSSRTILLPYFQSFASSLLSNGDLAKNLLDYIHHLPNANY